MSAAGSSSNGRQMGSSVDGYLGAATAVQACDSTSKSNIITTVSQRLGTFLSSINRRSKRILGNNKTLGIRRQKSLSLPTTYNNAHLVNPRPPGSLSNESIASSHLQGQSDSYVLMLQSQGNNFGLPATTLADGGSPIGSTPFASYAAIRQHPQPHPLPPQWSLESLCETIRRRSSKLVGRLTAESQLSALASSDARDSQSTAFHTNTTSTPFGRPSFLSCLSGDVGQPGDLDGACLSKSGGGSPPGCSPRATGPGGAHHPHYPNQLLSPLKNLETSQQQEPQTHQPHQLLRASTATVTPSQPLASQPKLPHAATATIPALTRLHSPISPLSQQSAVQQESAQHLFAPLKRSNRPTSGAAKEFVSSAALHSPVTFTARPSGQTVSMSSSQLAWENSVALPTTSQLPSVRAPHMGLDSGINEYDGMIEPHRLHSNSPTFSSPQHKPVWGSSLRRLWGSPHRSVRQLKSPAQCRARPSPARQLAYQAPENAKPSLTAKAPTAAVTDAADRAVDIAAAASAEAVNVTMTIYPQDPASVVRWTGGNGGGGGGRRTLIQRIGSTLQAAHVRAGRAGKPCDSPACSAVADTCCLNPEGAQTNICSSQLSVSADSAVQSPADASLLHSQLPTEAAKRIRDPVQESSDAVRAVLPGLATAAPLASVATVATAGSAATGRPDFSAATVSAVDVAAAAAESFVQVDTTQEAVATGVSGSQLLAVCAALPPDMKRRNWQLEDYKIIKRLYKGVSSAVYKATCIHSGLTVALKVYFLSRVPASVLHMICREIQIHSSVVHPNIVSLYGAFQTDLHLTLVMEYASRGDLYGIQQGLASRRMDERMVADLVLSPLLGVIKYLHLHGICHRDIKPENVLFTTDWQLKLADFGVSIDLLRERAVTRAGTACYMAPEVARCPLKYQPDDNKLDPNLSYGTACDIWGLGILTYELLVGFTPLGSYPPVLDLGESDLDLYGTQSPALIFPAATSPAPRDFVARCLSVQPETRPSAAFLSRHSWLSYAKAAAPAAVQVTKGRPSGASLAADRNGANW